MVVPTSPRSDSALTLVHSLAALRTTVVPRSLRPPRDCDRRRSLETPALLLRLHTIAPSVHRSEQHSPASFARFPARFAARCPLPPPFASFLDPPEPSSPSQPVRYTRPWSRTDPSVPIP